MYTYRRPGWGELTSVYTLMVGILVAVGCSADGDKTPTWVEDGDEDGWTAEDGDCQDDDPAIYPGADERCDAVDQDCDGNLDEGLVRTSWLVDQDGDGYGVYIVACTQPEGEATYARGDCDDTDPEMFPGATDPGGDGVDSDCGGTDAAEPHVQLTSSSLTTIQGALDVAEDGQTVWVGPGIYLEHTLSMGGKAVALRSTHGQGQTTVDAQGSGTVMSFDAGEGPSSVVDGFTLTGGKALDGGGMYLYNSSPTLTRLTLSQNTTLEYGEGGGMYLAGSNPTLVQVTLVENSAYFSGGGMVAYQSSPILTQVILSGNHASSGGGISLDRSYPGLTQVLLSGNTAERGGAIYSSQSSPRLNQVTITMNSATEAGGGIYLSSYSPMLTTPTLTHVILSHNVGANIWVEGTTPPVLSYCDLYNPYGPSHNLTDLDPTVLEVDPHFLALSLDGDPSNDDFHLRPGSPLINAGDPDLNENGVPWEEDMDDQDPDGSRMDMGTFGGTGADWSGYVDTDEDGLYDSWELAQGLSPGQDNGASDPDSDGMNNSAELATGTNPSDGDSDGDGYGDGVERDAGSDPLNLCSQPGVEGPVTLRVPEDYNTIQEAVNAAASACRIEVGSGRYVETVTIELRSIELVGTRGAEATVLDAAGQGPVLRVANTQLDMEGFTLTGGKAPHGGGLDLHFSDAALRTLSIEGNDATDEGGGVHVYQSSPVLTQLTLTGNEATYGGGLSMYRSRSTLSDVSISENEGLDGGGMYLDSSDPVITDTTVSDNSAGSGGGMELRNSSPVLSRVTLTGNLASSGGGMYLDQSHPTMTEVTLAENAAAEFSGYGGGMYLIQSSPTLTWVTLTGNSAGGGGGMILHESSPTLTQVTLIGNSATSNYGGGMYLRASDPTLTRVNVANNSALYAGGGIMLFDSSPSLTQVSLSGNNAENGGGLSLQTSSPILTQVLISGNRAIDFGGGILSYYSDPVLTHVNITGNSTDNVGYPDHGAGMYLSGSSPEVTASLIAYNNGSENISAYESTPHIQYCDVYPGEGAISGLTLDSTNLTDEPMFLQPPTYDYGLDQWIVTQHHLGTGSPLVDAATPDGDVSDPDGTRPDIGIYGGPLAGDWDRDEDGYPDWFWPGNLEDTPEGFEPQHYDVDDLDPQVH